MAFDTRLLSGVGVMVAVVDAGNFVRAAEALGLTASGVSRSIARLETRVGIKLFHRTPRAVALTDEGRRFHDEVRPLLSGIEEAAEEAAGAGLRGCGAGAETVFIAALCGSSGNGAVEILNSR